MILIIPLQIENILRSTSSNKDDDYLELEDNHKTLDISNTDEWIVFVFTQW